VADLSDNFMGDLLGCVRIHKRLRQHVVWSRPDYGWAWIDLLMLANDRPRQTFIKGKAISLERGQLAWSLRGLEKEWEKSGEWIQQFLKFLKDQDMVRVNSNALRTIITIVNYDAYNPQSTVTQTGSETDAEAVTQTGSETVRNRERGIGNRKGERASGPPEDFPETPTDEQIQAFCDTYRDLARGCENGIPEVWWRGWLASCLRSRNGLPKDWQRAVSAAFTADLVARHPKALSRRLDSAQPDPGTGENKKSGRSPAQARFEISKELESIQDRLEAAYELNQPPDEADRAREQILKKQLNQAAERHQ
jgi:hypothetical protein